MSWSDLAFSAPAPPIGAKHHGTAARTNTVVTDDAERVLLAALAAAARDDGDVTHLLLKAAAGAGKSYALKRLVEVAAGARGTRRIGITAFTNKQIQPLATDLARQLRRERVCLHYSGKRFAELPAAILQQVAVATTATNVPSTADVIVANSAKLGAPGESRRLVQHLGATPTGHLFDVLFVDEAWQLAHHQFDGICGLAPVIVGVGDVGQLPPLEIGANPWRGDRSHNPYRAWPVAYSGRPTTWERQLPAVWRPPAEALGLWRTFYPEWNELNCVAEPGERTVRLLAEVPSAPLWRQVGTAQPTLLEVTGLNQSEAPDVDLPLINALEDWLDDLFTAGFVVHTTRYDNDGNPAERVEDRPGTGEDGDPLVVILATRNQAVDDAADVAQRLRDKHGLSERDIQASTVDSWQGQTNAITIAIHPLNGAEELDEFNSAFGRLAVACTRATHGVLLLTRDGLDDLLATAAARPGTPFGEPGPRRLPRQTHQRILNAFARGTLDVRA